MRRAIVIADESVSALDVSVQKQVLDLLGDLQRRAALTLLFITHDLRVAAQIADQIAVMRRGEMVEFGSAAQILLRPQHPYTIELVAAAPGRLWQAPQLAAGPAPPEPEGGRIAPPPQPPGAVKFEAAFSQFH